MGVLLLLSIAGVQTGCLAIGGGYVGNDRFEPVFLTPQRATYAKFLYQTGDDLSDFLLSERRRIVAPPIPRAISKEDLLKAWGGTG